MAYDFASRFDRLRTRMREVNSRSVVYSAGDLSDTISATVYEAKAEDLAPWAISLTVRHFFVIVDVAVIEVVLGSGQRPKRNHVIMDETLGIRLIVEPMGQEPCYRYTNHLRRAVRIHAIEHGPMEPVGGSSVSSGS